MNGKGAVEKEGIELNHIGVAEAGAHDTGRQRTSY